MLTYQNTSRTQPLHPERLREFGRKRTAGTSSKELSRVNTTPRSPPGSDDHLKMRIMQKLLCIFIKVSIISIHVTQLEKTKYTCRLLYLQSVQYSPPTFSPRWRRNTSKPTVQPVIAVLVKSC